MFWNSLCLIEQAHTPAAYVFKLGECYGQSVRDHQLRTLAKIDADLCAPVADGPGVPVPDGESGDASPGVGGAWRG